jgi:hypothetical protein
MRSLCTRLALIGALLVLGTPAFAQGPGGLVTIRANDTSTGAPTDVGDNTNHALRVNIVAGAGSGGTALADDTTFTQGTTNETPAGCLYITSYSAATSGKTTVLRCTSGGDAYANIDAFGGSAIGLGQGLMAASIPVVIASNQSAIPASQSGTWNIGTVTTITNAVITKPIDACGTTAEDFDAKLTGTTLTSVTGTTTCVDTITVSNIGSASTTALIEDGEGTPVVFAPTVPVPANGSIVYNLNGQKFSSGIQIQASASNALVYWIHGRQ